MYVRYLYRSQLHRQQRGAYRYRYDCYVVKQVIEVAYYVASSISFLNYLHRYR